MSSTQNTRTWNKHNLSATANTWAAHCHVPKICSSSSIWAAAFVSPVTPCRRWPITKRQLTCELLNYVWLEEGPHTDQGDCNPVVDCSNRKSGLDCPTRLPLFWSCASFTCLKPHPTFRVVPTVWLEEFVLPICVERKRAALNSLYPTV